MDDDCVLVREMLADAPREVTVPGSGLRFALADNLLADHRRDRQAP